MQKLPEIENPKLVSVILICHNHANFVVEALESVLGQDYAFVQLIVVDDGSQDGSVEIIKQFIQEKIPSAQSIFFEKSRGICAAFNAGFALAKGKYIVDFSADDVFLAHRISQQVLFFEQQNAQVGVIFSDAVLIDENGDAFKNFYSFQDYTQIPQGKIYESLLRRSFICTPSQMFRREVLEDLGGYDEQLSYEDFDFWVRSAPKWDYTFQPAVLTKKRILKNSSGKIFYQKNNPHLYSTYRVCEKAFAQNQTPSQNQALAVSVRYHLRQSVLTESFGAAQSFAQLLAKISPLTFQDKFWIFLSQHKISLHTWYEKYRKWRY